MKQRIYYPGDEWLYFKIYMNPINANDVLSGGIKHFIFSLSSQNLVSKWFFVRYLDPNFHLRLRVRMNDSDSLCSIIKQLKSVLKSELESGMIYRICIDTYQRELERYGDDYIDECESFFCKDSLAILEFFSSETPKVDEVIECVGWMKMFLYSLGMSNGEILYFADVMKSKFSKELNLGVEHKVLMDKEFRNYKNTIIREWVKDNIDDEYDKDGMSWLASHSQKDSIVASLIHMHCNRFFATHQRRYECFAYHILYKSALSVIKMTE